MPTVTLDGVPFGLTPGESVLAGLERHGVDLPSSCRSGVCQSCALRLVDGSVPPAAQRTLKEPQRRRGIFLPCCCVPTEDITSERCGDGQARFEVSVSEVDWLSDTVVRLRMTGEGLPEYEAGQFMNLVLPDGVVRSFSLAGVPDQDSHLEFHIAILPGGRASSWAAQATPGTPASLAGPLGDCTYVAGEPDRPLTLVGTGTGLAPLYGILRTALSDGHRGPIRLFHGSVRREGLYLVDELRALAAEHDSVSYHPSILTGSAEEGISLAPLDQLLAETLPDLKGHRVYICGAPELVTMMQRKVFMAGASLQDIHADAFLPAASP